MDERILTFEGVSNFRDLGGIATADGGRLRRGILFRSDELSRLTAADRARLAGLKLRTLVDLRTPDERKSHATPLPDGARLVQVALRPQQEYSRGQLFATLLFHPGRVDFERLIREYYFTMAFGRTAEVGQVVRLLADEANQPALIHCTAGKDRTGFLAALIQRVAGATPEAVLEDYLLTNRLLRADSKGFIRSLRWVDWLHASPGGLQPVLEARPGYLLPVLDEIQSRYGGIEAYLSGACGVPPQDLERLKRRLAA